MIDLLIPIAVVFIAITIVIWREPVHGVYLYLFGAAILLTKELPVVREKLAACDFIMLVVLTSFLTKRSKWNLRSLLPIQISAIKFCFAYVVICAMSILLNFNSIVKIERSLVELAVFVYGFVTFIAIIALVDTREKWRNCLIAWCFGAGVVGIVATLAATGIYDPPWGRDEFTRRISSTLRESGQVSSFCGPILPFLVFASSISVVPTWVRRILYLLIIPVMIAILGSGSRTAFLILVTSLAGLFLLRPLFPTRNQLGNFAFWLIALAVTVGLGKIIYDVATDTSQVYTAGQTSPFERPIRILAEWWRGDRGFDSTRERQAIQFSERYTNHPILGIGLGNYSAHYRTHEIHNSYISSLAETGAVGLAALLLWLVAVWHNGTVGLRNCRNLDYRLLIACVLFGFILLLLYQLTILGLRQRPWWFLSALVLCIPRIVVDQSEVRSAAVLKP